MADFRRSPSTGHTMAGHAAHMQMAGAVVAPTAEIAAVAVHTAAMFLVMGAIAVVVFEKLGLAILRRAWVNLDPSDADNTAWQEMEDAAVALLKAVAGNPADLQNVGVLGDDIKRVVARKIGQRDGIVFAQPGKGQRRL